MYRSVDETQLKKDVEDVNSQIKKLFEEKDVEKLVKHYAEDCKFILMSEPTLFGRKG